MKRRALVALLASTWPAAAAAVRFPITIHKGNLRLVARHHCEYGPEITLEVKGDMSHLTDKEMAFVTRVRNEMRQL